MLDGMFIKPDIGITSTMTQVVGLVVDLEGIVQVTDLMIIKLLTDKLTLILLQILRGMTNGF
jgi:hypothetical protein